MLEIGVVGVLIALGADDAVPAGAEEEQRLEPGSVVVAEAEHCGHPRAPLAVAANIDEQLAALIGRQLAESR